MEPLVTSLPSLVNDWSHADDMENDGDGGDPTTVGVSIYLGVSVLTAVARWLKDTVTAVVVAAGFIGFVELLFLG